MLEYGFYNSMNGDRRYNSVQMSEIFEGLITDGVYPSVGNMFAVTPGEGLQVIVGTGRAWFNATWSRNKSAYPMGLEQPDPVLSRIDSVCIKVDKTVGVRANSFVVLKGTPANTPVAPTLPVADDVYYHPIANVTVGPNASTLTAANIKILVGTSACPFTTSILQQTDIDVLFANWEQQFMDWWDTIKAALDEDVALNLLNRMDAIEKYAGPDSTTYVKTADKATAADVTAGTNDAKWVTPLGIRNGITAKGLADKTQFNIIGSQTVPSGYIPFNGGAYSSDMYTILRPIVNSPDQKMNFDRYFRFDRVNTVVNSTSMGLFNVSIGNSVLTFSLPQSNSQYTLECTRFAPGVTPTKRTLSVTTFNNIADIVVIDANTAILFLTYAPSTTSGFRLKIVKCSAAGTLTTLASSITLNYPSYGGNVGCHACYMEGAGNNIVFAYRLYSSSTTTCFAVISTSGSLISQFQTSFSNLSYYSTDRNKSGFNSDFDNMKGYFTRVGANYYIVDAGRTNTTNDSTLYKWNGSTNTLDVVMTYTKGLSLNGSLYRYIGYQYNSKDYIAIVYTLGSGATISSSDTACTLVCATDKKFIKTLTSSIHTTPDRLSGHYPVSSTSNAYHDTTADYAFYVLQSYKSGYIHGWVFKDTVTTESFVNLFPFDESLTRDMDTFELLNNDSLTDSSVIVNNPRYMICRCTGRPRDMVLRRNEVSSSDDKSLAVIDKLLNKVYTVNYDGISFIATSHSPYSYLLGMAFMTDLRFSAYRHYGMYSFIPRSFLFLDHCPPLCLKV